MKLGIFNTKPFDCNAYMTRSIYKAFKKRFMGSEDIAIFISYADGLDKIRNLNLDVILFTDGGNSNNYFVHNLATYPKVSIVWYFDDPYDLKNNIENSKIFDIIFTNDNSSVPLYNRPDVFFLPLGADPDDYFKSAAEYLLYDLSFIGTAWPNRIEILKMVSNLEMGKFHFKLVPPEKILFVDDIPHEMLSQGVGQYAYSLTSNRSLFTLYIGRDFSLDALHSSKSFNFGPRFFENNLSGTLHLILSNEPLLSDTSNYPNTFFLDDLSNLPDLINEFKIKSSERLRLINSSQKYSLQNDTWDSRVDVILDKLLLENN